MTEVAKLPLSCEQLVLLDESTLAACGREVVYFRSLRGEVPPSSSSSSAEVSLPRRVECFAPWHPPGSPLQSCGVFYAEGGRVHLRRCNDDNSNDKSKEGEVLRDVLRPTTTTVVDTTTSGGVESLHVFFGTVLAARTADAVACYALDPAAGRPQLIGRVALPPPAPTPADVVVAGGSPMSAGDGDRSLAVVAYCRATRRVGALLLAVGAARVTVRQQTRDGGLALPFDAVNASLSCASLDWSRREVLFVFTDTTTIINNNSNSNNNSNNGGSNGKTTTATLLLDTMDWAASSMDLTQLPSAPVVNVMHTHTGEAWAVGKSSGGGAVNLFKISSSGRVVRELSLQHDMRDHAVFLTVFGSSLFVLMGKRVVEVREDYNRNGATSTMTLCDWLMQQMKREEARDATPKKKRSAKSNEDNKIKNEVTAIVEFLGKPKSSFLAMIVRDSRYVSCNPEAPGEYSHAVLDTIQKGAGGDYTSIIRYIAVAQSLHPVTILRVLSATDPSVRLSLAVLLAKKPTLMTGGVRRLEWSLPTRSFCKHVGRSGAKLFTAALYETALAALAAGALGAVAFLCAVADFVIVAALGDYSAGPAERMHACNIVNKEEAEAEAAVAGAVDVLSSYARWALGAAVALGTITAHAGREHRGRKEAAVRDGVAHGIVVSRSVQIEPLELRGRKQ